MIKFSNKNIQCNANEYKRKIRALVVASSLCAILSFSQLSLVFKYLKRVIKMKYGSKGLKNHSSSVKIQSTYQTYENETHGEPFELKQRIWPAERPVSQVQKKKVWEPFDLFSCTTKVLLWKTLSSVLSCLKHLLETADLTCSQVLRDHCATLKSSLLCLDQECILTSL